MRRCLPLTLVLLATLGGQSSIATTERLTVPPVFGRALIGAGLTEYSQRIIQPREVATEPSDGAPVPVQLASAAPGIPVPVLARLHSALLAVQPTHGP